MMLKHTVLCSIIDWPDASKHEYMYSVTLTETKVEADNTELCYPSTETDLSS